MKMFEKLDFNACLTLMIIGFGLTLIAIRCLMAVANRGFLIVDYAKKQLYGDEKGKGGAFGVKDLMGTIMQAIGPTIAEKAKEFLTGKKPG